jgi:hypothetical protein
VATWQSVRRLAAKLPESEERTSWGKPSLFVRKKLFACMSTREEGALVLRVERDERPLMMESRPEVFYLTPHYESGDWILVRLDAVDLEELEDRLVDSWCLSAPPKLAAQLSSG